MKTLPNIILASKSPRRRRLLTKAGYKFDVFASNAPENSKIQEPHRLTRLLSRRKAKAASKKFPESVIISADTMVCMDNILYGKPSDFNEAVSMLSSFSGKSHRIITGITVMYNNKIATDSDEGLVQLRNLSESEIINFINTTNPYDKAGGYSIEDLPKDFIEKIVGEMSTIIGLPMHLLSKHLKTFMNNS